MGWMPLDIPCAEVDIVFALSSGFVESGKDGIDEGGRRHLHLQHASDRALRGVSIHKLILTVIGSQIDMNTFSLQYQVVPRDSSNEQRSLDRSVS